VQSPPEWPGRYLATRLPQSAQSTVATRRWGVPAIVTLVAMAALAALTADAATRQARPGPTTEARAPREAGEPIMAIVWIGSQQVTFYDADGRILRAPVSTGTTGRLPIWQYAAARRPVLSTDATALVVKRCTLLLSITRFGPRSRHPFSASSALAKPMPSNSPRSSFSRFRQSASASQRKSPQRWHF
jgi:hypothetical protein